MKETASYPRRGEIWWVDFQEGRGSELKGKRPAVILQNDIGNRHAATTIVAAITTTIKEYPVTVILEKGEGGLIQKSMINLAQLLTLDKKRLLRRQGELSSERKKQLGQALKVSLSLLS